MSRRRITDAELARLERLAGLDAPPTVEVLRERIAHKLTEMRSNLEASAALIEELSTGPVEDARPREAG